MNQSEAMFDKVERYPNCTVEVLTNTTTGETQTNWWPNDRQADTPEEEEGE